jgi:hypothetical protein
VQRRLAAAGPPPGRVRGPSFVPAVVPVGAEVVHEREAATEFNGQIGRPAKRSLRRWGTAAGWCGLTCQSPDRSPPP